MRKHNQTDEQVHHATEAWMVVTRMQKAFERARSMDMNVGQLNKTIEIAKGILAAQKEGRPN